MDELAKGRVVLIGDATHAMTPYLGQGTNIGQEDAAELSHVLAPVLRGKNVGKEKLCGGLLALGKARRERIHPVHATRDVTRVYGGGEPADEGSGS